MYGRGTTKGIASHCKHFKKGQTITTADLLRNKRVIGSSILGNVKLETLEISELSFKKPKTADYR